jgi:hypothetical protein
MPTTFIKVIFPPVGFEDYKLSYSENSAAASQ